MTTEVHKYIISGKPNVYHVQTLTSVLYLPTVFIMLLYAYAVIKVNKSIDEGKSTPIKQNNYILTLFDLLTV